MRRAISTLGALAMVAVLPVVAQAPAAADPALPSAPAPDPAAKRLDNRVHPLAAQRTALRQQAVDQLVGGEAALKGRGRNRTIQLSNGVEVDYPATQQANLLTFLVEFGDSDPADLADPSWPAEGPLHNEIPEPGPEDNTTYWKPSFERGHFMDMFFNGMADQGGESFKDLYDEMSSGRFDLTGDVSDWVQVPEAEAYYNDGDGYENQPEMTAFIGDAANAWYDAQLGDMNAADIQDYLSQFDVWDRYDLDGDGDTTEPDGYIDHFQAVHAGEGEEAGAPPWAIWSHRWAANLAGGGTDGPVCPGGMEVGDPATDCLIGGVEIGDSGFYIFDYTTEPENGGLGVFAHEFGHDLGLPDYYDTNPDGGDNSNGFWTLMDSGSWLGHGDGATGHSAGHMGATEKLFLGWYGAETPDGFDDLAVVDGTGEPEEVVLGPSYHATETGKQAVLVTLPDGHDVADGPVSGDYLYSGTRDGTSVTATGPAIALPGGSPTLTANVQYAIEDGYDFAFLDVSTDDGASWTPVMTNLSVAGGGITGNQLAVTALTADLSAYAGQQVRLRWRYVTDGNTHGVGLVVHDLAVGGYSTSFADAGDWARDGFFAVVGGTYDYDFAQSYIAENRTFDGYDVTLAEGPYSHDYAVTAPGRRVNHYAYEDGLLLYYSNGAYGDNNTSEHPGYGANLPVDANPELLEWSGTGADETGNGRLQTFDATFDVDDYSELSLTREVVGGGTQSVHLPERPSVPVFEDNAVDAYWAEGAGGWFGTKVAGVGTTIQVVSSDEQAGEMVVKIGGNFIAQVEEPTITGDAVVGGQLTLTPGWYQEGVTSQVTWQRDGVDIAGAGTGLTYQPVAADIGHKITAEVEGSKDGWASASAQVADGPTVAAGAAATTTTPLAISGTPSVGTTLTATPAGWSRAGTSAFSWSVGATKVGTGTTYVVAPADLGKAITLTETRSTPGYADASTSASTAVVGAGAAPAATTPPRITGAARVGSELTVTGGTWPRAGSSSYAWSIGGRSVGTGATYVVGAADVGKRVTVTETFTSTGYLPGTATATTATVAKAPVTLTVKVGKAKRNKKVGISVRAASPDLTVTGRVRIGYDGDVVDTLRLKNGKVSLNLPKRPKGRYELTVTYLPDRGFRSANETVDVKVR